MDTADSEKGTPPTAGMQLLVYKWSTHCNVEQTELMALEVLTGNNQYRSYIIYTSEHVHRLIE